MLQSEMEAVVPWTRLLALIEPHYPKMGAKGGRPTIPLEVMLRMYCLQQWYALSDPTAMRNKTDKTDARGTAQVLCSGWFNPIYIAALHHDRLDAPLVIPGAINAELLRHLRRPNAIGKFLHTLG